VINERRTQSGESPAAHCDEQLFYVAPEQLIRDRAELRRRKSRGAAPSWARSSTTVVVLVAENPSASLFKISEIYDRIASPVWASTTNLTGCERRASAPTRPGSPTRA